MEKRLRKRFKTIAELDVDDDDMFDLPESRTNEYYRYGHKIESNHLASESDLYFRWSKLRQAPGYDIPNEANQFLTDVSYVPEYLGVGPDGIESSRYRNIVVDPQYWLPLFQVIMPNWSNPECVYTICVQVRKNSPFHGHISVYAELEEHSYSMTLRHVKEYQNEKEIIDDLQAMMKFEFENVSSERASKIHRILDEVYMVRN